MPKTEIKFNHELCPKKPSPLILDVGTTLISAQVTIETAGPVNPAAKDRWDKKAREVADAYTAQIQKTVTSVEAKIHKLNSEARTNADPELAKKARKDCEELAKGGTFQIQNAAKALSGAMQAAILQLIKDEVRQDGNLKEAKVAVVVNGFVGVLKVGKEVAMIVVTGGANIKAWINLGKEIVALGKLVQDSLKNEIQLRDDLVKATTLYITTKQKRVDQQKKADKDWKLKAKLFFKGVYKSLKSLADKAEASRKKYYNEITVMRKRADDLGLKSAALYKEVKGASNLKDGIQMGAQLMALTKQMKDMNGQYDAARADCETLGKVLSEAGVDVDDRTVMERLKALDTAQIKASLTNVSTVVSAIKGLVEALV